MTRVHRVDCVKREQSTVLDPFAQLRSMVQTAFPGTEAARVLDELLTGVPVRPSFRSRAAERRARRRA